MRILCTNDDGIHAPGLKVVEEIARALSDDVWIVAPELDQSGVSHSLSLNDPLRLRAQDWINVADFDKGMEVARKRYKQPSRAVPPPPVQIEKPAELPPQQPESIAPDEPAPGKFQMRFSGVAKFIRPWRVRNKE